MTTAMNQPGAALDREQDPVVRELLVRSAILAPSMHNAQPWRYRFRHRTVEVHRDLGRESDGEDRDDRLAMIGVGATVFNLRVAAATLARATTIAVLPNPDVPTLAAEVTLERGQGEGTELAGLFLHLRRRRTNRQAFVDRVVPHAAREALEAAAVAEGTRLHWPTREQVRLLRRLASDADSTEVLEAHRIVERCAWAAGDRYGDATPSAIFDSRSAGLSGPVPHLDVLVDRQRRILRFEEDPILAIVATTKDSPHDWLAAGQALQRALLVAADHRLSASLLQRPVERDEFRGLLRDQAGSWTATQVAIRLGSEPTVPPAPRRPYEDFIVDGGTSPCEAGAERDARSSPAGR